jgi:hypothetical protein
MKRLLLSQLFLITLLMLLHTNAVACSCGTPSEPTLKERVNKELKNSAVVFSGRVVSVTKIPISTNVAVKFLTNEFWKGSLGEHVTVITGGKNGICGFRFRVGESYLVYAGNAGEKKDLFTHSCTRTARLSVSGEDLKILGEPRPAPETSTETQTQKKQVAIKTKEYEGWRKVELKNLEFFIPQDLVAKSVNCYEGNCYRFENSNALFKIDLDNAAWRPTNVQKQYASFIERTVVISGRAAWIWSYESGGNYKYVSGANFRTNGNEYGMGFYLFSKTRPLRDVAEKIFKSIHIHATPTQK